MLKEEYVKLQLHQKRINHQTLGTQQPNRPDTLINQTQIKRHDNTHFSK